MRIFTKYKELQSVSVSNRGLELNGFTLEQVRRTYGLVSWEDVAIQAFEDAYREIRKCGLVGCMFTIWRQECVA